MAISEMIFNQKVQDILLEATNSKSQLTNYPIWYELKPIFVGEILKKTKMDKKTRKRNHADLHEAYQTLYGTCLREGVSSDEEEEEWKPDIAAFSVDEAFRADEF